MHARDDGPKDSESYCATEQVPTYGHCVKKHMVTT